VKNTDLKDLGRYLHDGVIGFKVIRGLLPINKRLLHPFMANHDLDCTLENISELCSYADEMDEDPNPDNNSESGNSVPLQAYLVNSDRLSRNSLNSQQTIDGSNLPQQTTGLTKVNGIKYPK